MQTLRFMPLHRTLLLMRPGGESSLRLAQNATTEQLFTRIEQELSRGAKFVVGSGLDLAQIAVGATSMGIRFGAEHRYDKTIRSIAHFAPYKLR
jgi:hypothetical protein